MHMPLLFQVANLICTLYSNAEPSYPVYIRFTTNRTDDVVTLLGFQTAQNSEALVLAYYSTLVGKQYRV